MMNFYLATTYFGDLYQPTAYINLLGLPWSSDIHGMRLNFNSRYEFSLYSIHKNLAKQEQTMSDRVRQSTNQILAKE